jgi:hypothetical protein
MKKLLLVSLFILAFIEDSFAEKIKLKCQGLVGAVFNEFIYVNFDDKIVEVVQGSGGNKVEFEIRSIDEYTVVSNFKVLAQSGMRAIKLCAPYDLPKDKYEAWKNITINFKAV